MYIVLTADCVAINIILGHTKALQSIQISIYRTWSIIVQSTYTQDTGNHKTSCMMGEYITRCPMYGRHKKWNNRLHLECLENYLELFDSIWPCPKAPGVGVAGGGWVLSFSSSFWSISLGDHCVLSFIKNLTIDFRQVNVYA